MGMDFSIYRVKDARVLEDQTFWDEYFRGNETKIQQAYYARKFWELVKVPKIHDHYQDEEWIQLDKDDVKQLLEIACYNRDYWDSFKTVPDLCELYDTWDEQTEEGWKFFASVSY